MTRPQRDELRAEIARLKKEPKNGLTDIFLNIAEGQLREVRGPTLNDEYRNGGDPTEYREGGSRDLCGDMALAARRPDVLANDLARMGIGEDGYEPRLPDE